MSHTIINAICQLTNSFAVCLQFLEFYKQSISKEMNNDNTLNFA